MSVEAALTGGGAIIAWQTPDGVYFEQFASNLDPEGSPVAVTTGATTWISAQPLAGGGFSIVWDSGVDTAPMAQNYGANGAAVGSPYSVATPPIAPVAFTSLADTFTADSSGTNTATLVLPDDGTVVAAFADSAIFAQNPGQPAEQIQQVDASGNPVGPELVINADVSGFWDNHIAPTANGGYLVSYIHNSSWTSELDVQSFASDGTHLGTIDVAHLGYTGNSTYWPEVLDQSIAGLPDGGFVASWIAQDNAPPQVFSEEFNAAGQPVGTAHLLGASADASPYTAPEIDAFADGQYTVTWTSPNGTQFAHFTEQGTPVSSGPSGDVVDTAALSYTVPEGVHDVVLTANAAQTVTGNHDGDTITSNDYGSTISGGTGNDTLIAGHGADVLTGGGGDDSFVFNALPWNAGHITDFHTATDTLDLTGIFNSIGYTGDNPVGDGYLSFQFDGHGNTLVYVDSHSSSDPWPTLITTLDGVSPSSITATDYGFDSSGSSSGGSSSGGTGGSGSGGGLVGSGGTVDTATSSYTAPAGVTDIVLTGTAAQTVTANSDGDTITSNDYGSTIIGGTGNDTLIAGHGADALTGGGGDDSFVFNYLPWNAGQITDFNPSSDTLNLSGIMHSIGYTGSNPIADGYVKFVDDGHGDTVVYVNPQGPSTEIPITITTLEHVSPSALHAGDYVFT